MAKDEKTPEELKVREFVRGDGKHIGGDMTAMALVIENGFGMGMAKGQIAQLLGMDTRTLMEKIDRSGILSDSYMKGCDLATQCVVAQIFRTAMGGYQYDEKTVRTLPDGKVETTVVTRTAPPNYRMQIYWTTNRDPEHWKHIRHLKADQTKTHKYELPEADKIAELGRGILGNNSFRPAGEPALSPVIARPAGTRHGPAKGVSESLHREADNSIQNDVLDVSAEEGTEFI